MRIITISGSARHGKTSTATMLEIRAKCKKYKIIVVHYADYLKDLCKKHFGWDGQKDEAGRTLLQRVGTDLCRKNNPDVWVNMVTELAKAVQTEFDYMLIPDTRFKNEIQRLKDCGFDVITVKVIRENFVSSLTQEQKNHISERDLDGYEFDYEIRAENLFELFGEVERLFKKIEATPPKGEVKYHNTKNLVPTVKFDFDGTLFTKAYPNIGKPKPEIIELAKRFKKQGLTVILDTCRTGKRLQEAIDACEKEGLIFDYVNENSPERIDFFGEDCRKISADWSFDDTSIGFSAVEEMLKISNKYEGSEREE